MMQPARQMRAIVDDHQLMRIGRAGGRRVAGAAELPLEQCVTVLRKGRLAEGHRAGRERRVERVGAGAAAIDADDGELAGLQAAAGSEFDG